MAKRKISGTNMVERVPHAAKAPADSNPAHQGEALAELILHDAAEVGSQMDAIAGRRKMRLWSLLELSQEARKGFTEKMIAAMGVVQEAQKAASYSTLQDFFDDFPKQGYMYAEASMWRNIVKAVDSGWGPTNDAGDKLPEVSAWPAWSVIKRQYADHNDKTKAASADPSNPQPVGSTRRRSGKQKSAPQTQAAAAIKRVFTPPKGSFKLPTPEVAAEVVASAARMVAPVGQRDLPGMVEKLCIDATIDELKEVAATIERMMVKATQAMEEGAKAAAKAAQTSADAVKKSGNGATVQRTSQGATVTRSAAVPSAPAPTANPESKADALIEAAANAQKQVESERKSRRRASAH